MLGLAGTLISAGISVAVINAWFARDDDSYISDEEAKAAELLPPIGAPFPAKQKADAPVATDDAIKMLQ